ncbi:hypothetical protein ED236_00605 [Pseudomethylobacillus aquaticus]|uniref:Outer membrane lipoprotein Blc n=1 Tax=Pseudomethylobacillus aquaticus TaxID=2676064 RepID=A0A3N0V5F6_9PROT|nr:hypothetical protein ED236_00605 [Pseudomethylobacillus aquaticus]
MTKSLYLRALLIGCALMLNACTANKLPPIATVSQVDLPRFMGDWYVIAAIPTLIETESYNAVESYTQNADGSIATTFRFNKGSLDGPVKTYKPTGFVKPGTGNALWGMQFIWPIKAEYLIAHLDAAYSQTIIARNARDYVWIMARSPDMSEAEYSALTSLVSQMGYDMSKLRRVPHQSSATKGQP